MSGEYQGQNPHETEGFAQEKSVLVDGRLGRQVREFDLGVLASNYPTSDRFTQVFFDTDSGNVYCIYDTRNGQFALVSANGNRGKGAQLSGTPLSKAELQNLKLVSGQEFNYGSGGRTTRVGTIVAVSEKMYSTSQDANIQQRVAAEHNMETNDIAVRFRKVVFEKPKT